MSLAIPGRPLKRSSSCNIKSISSLLFILLILLRLSVMVPTGPLVGVLRSALRGVPFCRVVRGLFGSEIVGGIDHTG